MNYKVIGGPEKLDKKTLSKQVKNQVISITTRHAFPRLFPRFAATFR